MYEDAACGKPCGMEPLGCPNCPEITGGYINHPADDDEWLDQ